MSKKTGVTPEDILKDHPPQVQAIAQKLPRRRKFGIHR